MVELAQATPKFAGVIHDEVEQAAAALQATAVTMGIRVASTEQAIEDLLWLVKCGDRPAVQVVGKCTGSGGLAHTTVSRHHERVEPGLTGEVLRGDLIH